MPDDKRKRSWKEIDAQRERGRSSSSGSMHAKVEELKGRESRQYRATLEALFNKGEIGKLADKLAPQPDATPVPSRPVISPAVAEDQASKRQLYQAVLEATSRGAITRSAKKYIAAYGWSDQFEFLEQLLDHEDDDIVREAMSKIETRLAVERPKRSRTLQGKLRLLEETSEASDIRETATRVRALVESKPA